MVAIWETNAQRPGRSNVVGPANFLRWQERATSFEGMAAFVETRANSSGNQNPEEMVAQNVTPPFFSVLGVEPMLGRVLTAEESADPQAAVVILSERTWARRRFGSENRRASHPVQRQTADCRRHNAAGGRGCFSRQDRLSAKPTDLWSSYALEPGPARTARPLSFRHRAIEIRA